MRQRLDQQCFALAIGLLLGISQAQGGLLIEMKMNETGTAAANTAPDPYDANGDTIPEARFPDGTMLTAGNLFTDLHSADGTGVSGLAGDRAFDAGGVGGGVIVNKIPGAWTGKDFTLSGWMKTSKDMPWGGGADGLVQQLVWGLSGSANQLRIRESGTENVPELWIASTTEGGTSAYIPALPLWANTQEWVFWAVSFEGSAASDTGRAKFYVGSKTRGVSLVSAADGISRTLILGDSFWWGNDTDFAKGFAGLMDNLRFHDEAVDLGELEALRLKDAIPEVTSLGLLVIGVILSMMRP